MPATKGVLKSGKDRKPSTTKRATGLSGRSNTAGEAIATMTHTVLGIKETMKDLAASMKDMRKASRGKTKQEVGTAGREPKSDSEESSDEGTVSGSAKRPTSTKGSLRSSGTKHKWYYVVARRGWVPGVYTDWGEAEKQVNGFSGSLHEKFKDRGNARWFVDKYQETKPEESDESSRASGSESESTSGDEIPRNKSRRASHTRGSMRNTGSGAGFPPLELTAPDPSKLKGTISNDIGGGPADDLES
jgi:hypothetical protein